MFALWLQEIVLCTTRKEALQQVYHIWFSERIQKTLCDLNPETGIPGYWDVTTLDITIAGHISVVNQHSYHRN